MTNLQAFEWGCLGGAIVNVLILVRAVTGEQSRFPWENSNRPDLTSRVVIYIISVIAYIVIGGCAALLGGAVNVVGAAIIAGLAGMPTLAKYADLLRGDD
jgi:hypothetical protein